MKLIFNNFTKTNHLSEIKSLLGSSKIKKAIISSAFATESGIYQIEKELTALNSKVDLFIGFNNGTTDRKALTRAFNSGCNLYVVGLDQLLYHPKIYFIETYTEAKIIIGSANLTNAGLENQYEASVCKNLDIKKDNSFINEILDSHNFIKNNKETKFISSIQDISLLEKQGFLKQSSFQSSNKSSTRKKPKLSKIKTKRSGLLKTLPKKLSPPLRGGGIHKINRANYDLVWTSAPLANSHLSLTSGNTNPKNDISLGVGDKKLNSRYGLYGSQDTSNYFPIKVFTNLKRNHKGQDEQDFDCSLEIFGKPQGVFKMKYIHKPTLPSASNKQNNLRNKIAWGDSIKIIRNIKHLGKQASLFKQKKGEAFLISID